MIATIRTRNPIVMSAIERVTASRATMTAPPTNSPTIAPNSAIHDRIAMPVRRRPCPKSGPDVDDPAGPDVVGRHRHRQAQGDPEHERDEPDEEAECRRRADGGNDAGGVRLRTAADEVKDGAQGRDEGRRQGEEEERDGSLEEEVDRAGDDRDDPEGAARWRERRGRPFGSADPEVGRR